MSSSCTPPETNIIQEELAAASPHRRKETTAGTLPGPELLAERRRMPASKRTSLPKAVQTWSHFLFREPYMRLKFPHHLLPTTTLTSPTPTPAATIATSIATAVATTAATGGTSARVSSPQGADLTPIPMAHRFADLTPVCPCDCVPKHLNKHTPQMYTWHISCELVP